MNKHRVIFFGTPEFSTPTLRALVDAPDVEVVAVVTQPDRPAGRGKQLQFSAVKKVALEHKIEVIQEKKIKSKHLKHLENIDVGIVIAFGQILSQACLDFPKHGCLNLHASLLPRWRGAAPIQRSIWAGDKTTGVSLMQMEAGLDTGPFYSTLEVPILDSDDAGSLHDKLASASAELLTRDLMKVINGTLTAQEQDDTQATYAKKITSAEEIINWNNAASEISLQVRALAPFPAAYSELNTKRVKILEVEETTRTHNQSPGEIVYTDKNNLTIACGDACLNILQVKPAGKNAMQIQQFLNGQNLSQGDLFS